MPVKKRSTNSNRGRLAGDTAMTERLRQCLQAGNVENLFPLLKEWPAEELNQVGLDINRYRKLARRMMRGRFAQFVREKDLAHNASPETLRQLEMVCDREILSIELVLAEIHGVVLYYQGVHQLPPQPPKPRQAPPGIPKVN
jgi:hypothetical protein